MTNQRIKKMSKRILMAILSFSMFCSILPAMSFTTFGATAVGSLNGYTYTDFDDLIDDLEDDYSGKTVTIEMLTNWDAAEDSDFDERLIIPSNCKATLNMNGYVFDRDNTYDNDSCMNGELITMESGSTLTINGGDTSKKHSERLYSSTDRDGTASTWRDFYGGVLTGGASDNGAGGIHVKSACNLTLNDVTLAGCRAHAPWYDKAGTNSAYGGGIWLTGGDTNLTLKNSTIIGCFAYYDGGGIFQSNHNNVRIELFSSHIDENYAGDEGGGINPDGEYIQIIGDGESTVSKNQAANRGGGIYAWNDAITISGLILEENRAGTNGGGIYTQESTVGLNNLVINNNYAAERGGGIYIANDGNTISSCEITGNSAGISGNGVYVGDNVDADFVVTGNTVIKDNSGSNLYFSDSDWSDTRVKFSLTKGAEVWVRYYDGNHDSIMVTPGKKGDTVKAQDCSQYLFSDQDGYYFTFDSAPNMRKIMRLKGQREDVPDPTFVPSSNANDASRKGSTSPNTINAGVVKQVGAGGYDGTEYDLIRGFYIHEKSDSGTDDNTGVFYYSDGFFYGDEYTYNPHLGTASWILAFSGTCLRAEDEADENGNTYYNKHAGSIQFMADIGCPDQKIYVNDTMVHVPETDTIGVTIASKELAYSNGTPTGDILIPVAVRGGGYESEWASNVTLGTADEMLPTKEAKGFADAADKVMKEIDYYLKKYDLEDEYKAGKVIFWVSGFSRAGATANLTSKRLVDRIAKDCTGDKKSRVFGYPCEAPKGGTNAAEVSGNNYQCIHNMINKVDVVPYVAPAQMGFKRYGVDHYIPGTDAGEVTRDTYSAAREKADVLNSVFVTTYYDNTYTPTKTTEYDNRRALMLSHLKAIDSHMLFDDYFHPMAMDFIPPKMYEAGDYDNNRAEDFVEDFIRFMQYGKFIADRDSDSDWSQAVVSREYWANELQNPMRDTMALVFSITADNKEGFANRAATIMNKISYIGGSDISMRQIYSNVIGNWHNLSTSEKEKYINFFWTKLDESGALEYLSKQDKDNLKKNWPAIANFLFRFIDGDYNFAPGDPYNRSIDRRNWTNGMSKTKTMTYLPTFATFSSYILSCHNPEVNISWAMTYDDYYQNGNTNLEPTEYEITPPDSVKAPAASVTIDEKDQVLKEGAAESNQLQDDQKIILENDDIVGEAVYYDLYDVSDGNKKIAKNQLYLGGIDLVLGENSQKSYRIETYDMSYKVKSEKAVYNINLVNSKHKVVVADKDKDGADRTVTSMYEEDAQATVIAGKSDPYYFTNWKVSLLDIDGNVITEDITDSILGSGDDSKAKNETAAFTVPKTEGDDYPIGYSLKFQAVYADKIASVNAPLVKPKEGENLAQVISVNLGNENWGDYPITWTYTYKDEEGNDQTAVTSGKAYQETAYTATVRINKDQANGIVFTNAVTVTTDPGTVVADSIKTDPNDGSLTFSIKFDPTGTEGGSVKPQTLLSLNLDMIDLNLPEGQQSLGGLNYMVHPGDTITLSAPQVEQEKFIQWTSEDIVISEADAQKSTISLTIPEEITAGTKLALKANYMPIVNSFDVQIEAPKGGQSLAQAPEYVKFTVSNTYTISPDCYQLTWTPASDASGKAAFLTEYTAGIRMTPKKDADGNEYIEAKNENGETVKFNTTFLYSDALQINVSASEEADNSRINGYSADTANNTVYIKFKPTNYVLNEVKQPDAISGLSHDNDNADAILGQLPKTVKILTENGQELEAKVNWETPERTEGDGALSASSWNAKGTIELPANVENTKNVPMDVSMTVAVNEADSVSSPESSLISGYYLADQYVTLSTSTEGATIYYTLNGDDPSDPNAERYVYNSGDEIAIKRANATKREGEENDSIVLRAVAEKDGMYSSDVSTFEYSFKIFSLKDAVVEVLEDPVRLKDGKAEPKIKVTLYDMEVPENFYKVIYSDNTKEGTGKVYVVGDGVNLIDESEPVEFTILPEEFTITYDLNGGTYEGKTGIITETHEDGETITLLGAPTKEGMEFDYWKGSAYKAGAKYKVEGDHTFTAQWKEPGAPSTAATGDASPITFCIIAMLLALIGLVTVFMFRKRSDR